MDELKIPKSNTEMKFAYPKTENGFAMINLICGENYTGKSFILSKIRSLYEEQRVEQFGFTIKYVQTDSDNMTNVLYFGKVWKHNDKCGGYTLDSKKTLNSSDGPKIYENILHFCYDLLFNKNELGITDNDFCNFQNVDLRLKLIDQLNIDVEGEKCYPCNKEHPLVQKLEKLFKNKRLYYRFTKLKGHSAPRFKLEFARLCMEKRYEFKSIGIKEIDIIKKLFTGVFTINPWNDDWSNEEQLNFYLHDLVGQSNSLTFGLFENEKLIAVSMGHIRHWYSGTEYYIDELCVQTDKQGCGIGTYFINEIEKAVKKKGLVHIFLLTENTVPAYDFYQKNDFLELRNIVAFAKKI